MNFVNKTAFKRKMLQLNYESKLARLDNNSHVVHSLQVAKEDTKKHHQKPVRFLFFFIFIHFQLNDCVFKKPKVPSNIICELFFEILQYLDRSEVEKCQLVSRHWNLRILDWTRSPRRVFYALEYHAADKWLREYRMFGHPPYHVQNFFLRSFEKETNSRIGKDIRNHGLKHAFFNQLCVGLDKESLKKFQKLVQIVQQPLECNILNLYFYLYHEVWYTKQFEVNIVLYLKKVFFR